VELEKDIGMEPKINCTSVSEWDRKDVRDGGRERERERVKRSAWGKPLK
jgi:hypothetical protein